MDYLATDVTSLSDYIMSDNFGSKLKEEFLKIIITPVFYSWHTEQL